MSGKHLTPEQCDRVRRLVSVHGDVVTCEMTGISSSTLHALKKRGFKPYGRPTRPVPNDWGLVAPGVSCEALRKHYNASPRVVARWLREKPVERPKAGQPSIIIPADALVTLQRMTRAEAATHYGVCYTTIGEWKCRLGLLKHQKQAAHKVGWVERYVADRRVA